jgi:parallel beta-helix repeat protein
MKATQCMTSGAKTSPRHHFPWRYVIHAFSFILIPAASAQPVVPTNGQVFTANTIFVVGTYNLSNGVFIGASGITLDLNGATLVGTGFNNFGVTCLGRDNVVIKNGTIRGYYYGVRVENGSGVQVLDNDLSANWRDPNSLTANPPFLNINAGPNLADRVNLGGGLFARNATSATVSRNTLRHQENGIDLYNVSRSTIDHNNASDNTGWGIHLYASISNHVHHNTADRCTRAHLNDSAGFLLVYGSSGNQILTNSFQSSGDGFFIGNEGGCPSNDNLVQGNNGSHAGANAFEATFSRGNQFIGNMADGCNYGFWLGYSHDGNVLRGNSVRANNASGIEIEHGQNNVVEDNDIIGNGGSGLVLRTDGLPHFPSNTGCLALPNPAASGGYIIRNNRIHSNYGTAIVLTRTTNCLIVNNLFGGPYAGTALSDGANNIWSIVPAPGLNIVGGPMLGGNWWFNYTGTDTNADGLGDTALPYANGGQIAAPGDLHPLIGSPDLANLGNPGTLCDHVWIDLGRNTRSSAATFDTANGTHFATDGTNLLLLEGANSTRLSLFDSTTRRYVPKASVPEGVQDGGDFQFGGALYFATVGLGFDTTTGAGNGSRLYAYNSQTNGWSAKAPTVASGQPVCNEALAYDPVGRRFYATIVRVKAAAAGGDPTLLAKLAIYDPVLDTWVGVTPAAPDTWANGSEAEYLDGRIYVWRGGSAGGAPNGSDSYLDVFDLATSTWSRTPTSGDFAVVPGFRTGGFDVWGVSLSADAAHHRLFVKGAETSRTLYVFDALNQAWAAGPTAPYDGGWGASIEHVAALGALYQIDGRNSAGTPQGSAILIPNTNTVRLEIVATNATSVQITARGTVTGTVYTLLSKTNLNEAEWHQELTFAGAGNTPLPQIPRAGRDTVFFLATLCRATSGGLAETHAVRVSW